MGMAEEVMGGEARMVEMNAHINSRDPKYVASKVPKCSFYNGADVPFSSHTKHGLFHGNFVKTLTNLTELDPDDSGMVVVAGCPKIDLLRADTTARA